ncbi:MAG: hypothetical protein ACOYK9_03910 [Chlamydiia bacterium]
MKLVTPARLVGLFLTFIGSIAMVGDLCDLPKVKGLAAAWGASVLPKVFSTADGLETFSAEVVFTIFLKDGTTQKALLTKELAAKLKGPYNRRNVYGALLVYGPVFQNNAKIAPMMEEIIAHVAVDNSPLIRDFGLDPKEIEAIEVELIPKHPERCTHLELKKKVFIKSSS